MFYEAVQQAPLFVSKIVFLYRSLTPSAHSDYRTWMFNVVRFDQLYTIILCTGEIISFRWMENKRPPDTKLCGRDSCVKYFDIIIDESTVEYIENVR